MKAHGGAGLLDLCLREAILRMREYLWIFAPIIARERLLTAHALAIHRVRMCVGVLKHLLLGGLEKKELLLGLQL